MRVGVEVVGPKKTLLRRGALDLVCGICDVLYVWFRYRRADMRLGTSNMEGVRIWGACSRSGSTVRYLSVDGFFGDFYSSTTN